jgi:hypothetical protein
MNALFKFRITRITCLAIPLPLYKTNRTLDDNMSRVKTITKQALHHLDGKRLVSTQEAVHMVDNQELVISSNKMTYLSLAQGQALRAECDTHAKRDLITIYQNRHQKYNQLSLEQFFIQVFIQSTFNNKTKDNSNTANDDNHEQEVVANNQH